MEQCSIHVQRKCSGDWLVRGGAGRHMRSFRLREHALAFGRAMAFAGRLKLFLHDEDGSEIRQTRASMTYPRVLT